MARGAPFPSKPVTVRSRLPRAKRLVFEPLEPRHLLDAGPLLISEFMAVNNTTLADEDGDFSDWIEIYNPTDEPVELTGWHLTDAAADLTKWGFPSRTLDPDEHLVVFASDKNRTGPELHTSFRLAGGGEYLALLKDDGAAVAHEYAPRYPEQSPDVSYGVSSVITAWNTPVPSGAAVRYRIPTPGEDVLAWTAADYDDSQWPGYTPPSEVLITEAGTESPDYAEIQNLSTSTVDTSGWVVAVNDASGAVPDINNVEPMLWHLPDAIGPNHVLYRSDDDADSGHYWGEDIFWRTKGPGWVMLVDDQGSLVDFVVWGYSRQQLDSLSVDIDGQQVTASDAWLGEPLPPNTASENTLQRGGASDHDDASDWAFTTPRSRGNQNAGLVPPFDGESAKTGIGFSGEKPEFEEIIQTDVAAAVQDVNASLWCRIRFQADDLSHFDTLTLRMKYDDGFVAYLNGVEVARRNAPHPLAYDSAATAEHPDAEAVVFEEIDLTEQFGLLQPGTNVLAVHGLNVGAADADFLILPELVTSGSQQVEQYLLAPTPGGPNATGSLVINEIHYDPEDNAEPGEFIELLNNTTKTVDVSGWRLGDAIRYRFPEGTTIPGGEYLVVAQDPATIQAKFGVSALGPWSGRLDNDGETIVLLNRAEQVQDEVEYKQAFPWPSATGGDGSSMELINPSLDNNLGGSWLPSGYDSLSRHGEDIHPSQATPTPGRQNSVWSLSPPPQVRQVEHAPQQPASGQPITITAKVTDWNGVASVDLHYQVVLAGSYIPAELPVPVSSLVANPHQPRPDNPAFENPANWTTVAMVDDGSGADRLAGDGIYTATIPGRSSRTLVRYRITARDTLGETARAPQLDDPSLNFACYVYDGVPDYAAATRSIHPEGSGHVYSSQALTSLPVYTLIARAGDITQMLAYSSTYQIPQSSDQAARRAYNWQGTFVYDGVVYDHVDMRLRGANGRYHLAGKRSMRIRFNPGHYLQARDPNGEEYPTKWRQLVVGKMFGNRQDFNWGLAETINNEMWRLVDVPAPYTHWFHFRVVDGTQEAPSGVNGQYYGDFWGMFLAFEPYDVRFLEAHDLPKGNLYKLTNRITDGKLQQRYQALGAVSNAEDYNNIRNNLNAGRSEYWLDTYVNYDEWYRYHAVAEAIKHYDYWPGANKNVAWYFEPVEDNPLGLLWHLPFDSDASWGPTWNAGKDEAKAAIYDSGGKPAMKLEYRNAIREIRDLIFQPEVIEPWIDRTAATIEEFWMAEYDRWEDAPAGAGSHNFDGYTLTWKAEDMKKFAFVGGYWPGGSVMAGGQAAYLDLLANAEGDAGSIPDTPTAVSTSPPGFPIDALSFQCGPFGDPQGNHTFAAVEWRIGEITDPAAPGYDPDAPWKYEITPAWQSGEITAFDDSIAIPGGVLEVGHTYRVRVRMKDTTGRWSHWSDPVELTTGAPLSPVIDALKITEIMYHPPDPTPEELAVDPNFISNDFEFIELKNTGDEALDLIGFEFADGIEFEFLPGANTELAPGEFVVLARDIRAFEARYGTGVNVAGEYGGRLDNAGEDVAFVDPYDRMILDFQYDNAGPWPGRADGKGASLEVIDTGGDYNDPDNWRSSSEYCGSPGTAGEGPRGDVLVNEVLTNTPPGQLDSIELLNTTDDEITIGGWYLSDQWGWASRPDNGNYRKYRIPDGTNIGPHEYRVFDESHFNPNGDWNPDHGERGANEFALDGARGDDVWLMDAGAHGKLLRFVDHVDFMAAKSGESFGRWPDGQGDLYPMTATTPGSPNSGPRVGPVVVSELHYNPGQMEGADDLEFIEIYNPTGEAVDLTAWRVRGGIDFDFAAGTLLPRYSTLVVLPFDPMDDADAARWSAFCEEYGLDLDYREGFVGGYSNKLDNGGERVQLRRPDPESPDESGFVAYVLEDEVRYDDEGTWPADADGQGESLHRLKPDAWGDEGESWTSTTPTPGVVPFLPVTEVKGRYVFYNNSVFDGNDPAANEQDQYAIATDKQALHSRSAVPGRQGQTSAETTDLQRTSAETTDLQADLQAGLANYTSYSRGINGIIVDIAGPLAMPHAGDFRFHVGNSDDPGTWLPGPAPSTVTVTPGAGEEGSYRITIVWPDYAIRNTWLQVTVLAGDLGLPGGDDVFYFGNAVGESGNSATDAIVDATDVLLTRNHPHNFFNPAEVTSPYDHNRDARVDATDVLIARSNQTTEETALRLLDLSGLEGVGGDRQSLVAVALRTESPSRGSEALPGKWAWLCDFARTQTPNRPSKRSDQARKAVDTLIETLHG